MKRVAIPLAALAAAWILYAQQAPTPAADPLLRAMRDEVQRSLKLNISGQNQPYFVQYLVDEQETFTVSASLGGVVSRRRQRFRSPQIEVRIGDYKFDNTNFGGGFAGGGPRFGQDFPVDDIYPVLRRYLWLETDVVYKAALEALSRKRAAMGNVSAAERQIDDFAHAEPVHFIRPFQPLTIDEDAWTNRVRKLSAVFNDFPEIAFSTVDLEATTGGANLVNSEGTEVKEPEVVNILRARATTQAADGMNIRDGVSFYSLDVAHMPSEAELVRGITEMARNMVALTRAPQGEQYVGPVLFEGQAGPQLFAELLGRNLTLSRRPVSAGGRGGAAPAGELEGRIGARVLPDSFDVVDDPTQKEWRGRPLFGSFDVDREGVIPKPLRLIEKGVLRGYLLTRQPVRGFERSNGRARLPGAPGASGAAISNLFVTSSNTVPIAELKKNLMELIRARGKDYGIIVRKMDYPPVAGAPARGYAGRGAAPSISAPVLVYKLFPDGREELVRGLRFRGVNVRSLKDILAAADDSQALEFMNTQSGFSTETCVIAPSVLIDDLELYPSEEVQPRLPVVAPPEITK